MILLRLKYIIIIELQNLIIDKKVHKGNKYLSWFHLSISVNRVNDQRGVRNFVSREIANANHFVCSDVNMSAYGHTFDGLSIDWITNLFN